MEVKVAGMAFPPFSMDRRATPGCLASTTAGTGSTVGTATPTRATQRWRRLWLGLSALGCAWPALGAAPKPAGCLIEPDQVADVGSPVTGVIERLPVALGDTVQVGQPLVFLRTDVERANTEVATLRAQVESEIKAAAANLTLAQQKVGRTRQLLAQQFVSPQALDQAQAEADVASQKLALARSQQRIYAQERAVSQAQLDMRTLRSPIRGVVVERYSQPGERVEDRPVIRVATIDPLRVSLLVPMAQYGQVGVGDVLTIRPELAGVAPLRATVHYVDKVVDAASNTFRVRLQLPNPDHKLPGGLRCKVDWAAAPVTSPALRPPAVGARTPAPVQARRLALAERVSVVYATEAPAPRPLPSPSPSNPLSLRTSWTLSPLPAHRLAGSARRPAVAHAQAAAAPAPATLSFSLAMATPP
ncbi:MAG: efflux RND transporter periplasmic adaptor subunit [Rubrivivax sp.]|nr:MAG: efflux RND transporter periplasmic adaptor subunit [Rubrivivax sp.]